MIVLNAMESIILEASKQYAKESPEMYLSRIAILTYVLDRMLFPGSYYKIATQTWMKILNDGLRKALRGKVNYRRYWLEIDKGVRFTECLFPPNGGFLKNRHLYDMLIMGFNVFQKYYFVLLSEVFLSATVPFDSDALGGGETDAIRHLWNVGTRFGLSARYKYTGDLFARLTLDGLANLRYGGIETSVESLLGDASTQGRLSEAFE